MAITFVAGQGTSNASAQTLTPSEPAGALQDDLIIAFANINSIGAWTDPADFIEIDQEDTSPTRSWQSYVGYKIRGADAGSGYQFASVGTAAQIVVSLVAFRGVDTSVPFDVAFVDPTHYNEYTHSVTGAAKPITTATDNAWVVLLQHWGGAVIGFALLPPSGYASRHEILASSRTSFIVSKEIASAGTETPGVYATTGTVTTQDSANYTLALRPAAAVTTARGRMLMTGIG